MPEKGLAQLFVYEHSEYYKELVPNPQFMRKGKPSLELIISLTIPVIISTCAEDDSYFEPLSDNYLVHFTRLMELYQSKSEEDLHD